MIKNSRTFFGCSLALLLLLILLPGCVGYHELVPQEFSQHKYKNSYWYEVQSIAEKNLKSVRFYDEFLTVALFDFVRYSDELAMVSANIKCDRKGVNRTLRQQAVTQELMNNQEDFRFLLQADVRNCVQTDLTKNNSPWTFWLLTDDGKKVQPSSIKKLEHTEITQHIFGERYSRFKQLYQITFPLSGNDLMAAKNRRGKMNVVCRSSERKCTVNWPALENTD